MAAPPICARCLQCSTITWNSLLRPITPAPNAVLKHKGVPPYAETRAYVAAVMDYLARTSVPETK